MTFDEIYAQLPGTGWLSVNEARLLHDETLKAEGNVLEVGCYHGRSTCLFGLMGKLVFCVDPFQNFDDKDMSGASIRASFEANVMGRGIGSRVRLFPMRIEDWSPALIANEFGRVGLAYLDGDHTYQGTKAQIEKALELLRPKRAPIKVWDKMTVCIHDVNDSGGGVEVKRAAVEILGPWDERVERLAVWHL